jgi:hypothetical protein
MQLSDWPRILSTENNWPLSASASSNVLATHRTPLVMWARGFRENQPTSPGTTSFFSGAGDPELGPCGDRSGRGGVRFRGKSQPPRDARPPGGPRPTELEFEVRRLAGDAFAEGHHGLVGFAQARQRQSPVQVSGAEALEQPPSTRIGISSKKTTAPRPGQQARGKGGDMCASSKQRLRSDWSAVDGKNAGLNIPEAPPKGKQTLRMTYR